MTDLTSFLRQHDSVMVFSGAGISTESGIPDFRSPGGVWTRYDPRDFTFDRFAQSPEVRARSWAMRREFFATGAAPNAAHVAVARLESAGRGPGVVTQNIDGLHQAAGSTDVVEIHGTAREVMCIGAAPRHGVPDGCGFRVDTSWAFDQVDQGTPDPMCPRCGGLVKSATVSFGQAMDEDAMTAASDMIGRSDAVLVIGSSLQVYPAAAVPRTAVERGLALAIVNAEPTPLDDLADLVVHGQAGQIVGTAVADVLS
jgi:NAD-dependent deacetylase